MAGCWHLSATVQELNADLADLVLVLGASTGALAAPGPLAKEVDCSSTLKDKDQPRRRPLTWLGRETWVAKRVSPLSLLGWEG